MEIEVGEYVRSLVNGGISKVLEVSDLLEEPNVKYYKTGKFTGFCSTEEDNVKHSKNIIDLIEVGDYVNGEPVEKVEKDEFDLIEITTTTECLYKQEDIKSIVTKEQFNEMEYKVEY